MEELLKGPLACCCQEIKNFSEGKHKQLAEIIELWKRKAFEQTDHWQR
jgi:hypothetical protein